MRCMPYIIKDSVFSPARILAVSLSNRERLGPDAPVAINDSPLDPSCLKAQTWSGLKGFGNQPLCRSVLLSSFASTP
jgi:hypothetical protein